MIPRSGAAGVLRWEEDAELRRVSEEIVGKMKARQRADGYYNYYPEEASFALTCFPEEAEGRELPYNYYSYKNGDPLTERKNADRSSWTRGMVEAVNASIPDDKLHCKVPGTAYTIMPYWDAPEEGFTCVPIVSECK